jgi:hypothetical protein
MHLSRALVAQLRCAQHSSGTAARLQLQRQARDVHLMFEAAAAGDANGAYSLQRRRAARSPLFARAAGAKQGQAGRRLQLAV